MTISAGFAERVLHSPPSRTKQPAWVDRLSASKKRPGLASPAAPSSQKKEAAPEPPAEPPPERVPFKPLDLITRRERELPPPRPFNPDDSCRSKDDSCRDNENENLSNLSNAQLSPVKPTPVAMPHSPERPALLSPVRQPSSTNGVAQAKHMMTTPTGG